MKTFKLTIEYDGTNYFGWQRQSKKNNLPTIQASIENAVKKVTDETVPVVGAGRTDTGVHALGQVAAVTLDTRLGAQKFEKALNANLPDDILIYGTKEVNHDFHPRYNAKKKWYRYTILNSDRPSVLNRHYSFHYPYKLDLAFMNKAAKALKGEHDFSGIGCKSNTKNGVREIYSLEIEKIDNFVYIDVAGNGFLYKMVRRLAGLLVMAGGRKMTIKNVKKILSDNNFHINIKTLPAKGLCLMCVEY